MNRTPPLRGRTGCTAALGSLTVALKAQRHLGRQAIRADIVKINRKSADKGCSYGIEYECAFTGNVRKLLTEAGIEILN